MGTRAEGKNFKEEHHIIPISIQGPNWKENVITLSREDHKYLHDIMDIPYGWLRRFRKRTNHLVYMDAYYVSQVVQIQKLYFARLPQLTPRLINIHMTCMEHICMRAYAEYEIKKDIKPKRMKTGSQQFMYWLELYHEALYIIAARLEEKLPPQIHPTQTNNPN